MADSDFTQEDHQGGRLYDNPSDDENDSAEEMRQMEESLYYQIHFERNEQLDNLNSSKEYEFIVENVDGSRTSLQIKPKNANNTSVDDGSGISVHIQPKQTDDTSLQDGSGNNSQMNPNKADNTSLNQPNDQISPTTDVTAGNFEDAGSIGISNTHTSGPTPEDNDDKLDVISINSEDGLSVITSNSADTSLKSQKKGSKRDEEEVDDSVVLISSDSGISRTAKETSGKRSLPSSPAPNITSKSTKTSLKSVQLDPITIGDESVADDVISGGFSKGLNKRSKILNTEGVIDKPTSCSSKVIEGSTTKKRNSKLASDVVLLDVTCKRVACGTKVIEGSATKQRNSKLASDVGLLDVTSRRVACGTKVIEDSTTKQSHSKLASDVGLLDVTSRRVTRGASVSCFGSISAPASSSTPASSSRAIASNEIASTSQSDVDIANQNSLSISSDEEVLSIPDSVSVAESGSSLEYIDQLSSSDEDDPFEGASNDDSTDIGLNFVLPKPVNDSSKMSGDASADVDVKQLNEILGCLPACDWSVSEEDRYGGNVTMSRYYNSEARMKCRNCQQKGHAAANCSEAKKQQVCVVCGHTGHFYVRCPRALCFRCKRSGHQQRDCPHRSSRRDRCKRCSLIGHAKQDCTEQWRQYHRTTEDGCPLLRHEAKVGKKNGEFSVRITCYNCAEFHLGHECTKSRPWQTSLPGTPFLRQYDVVAATKQKPMDGLMSTPGSGTRGKGESSGDAPKIKPLMALKSLPTAELVRNRIWDKMADRQLWSKEQGGHDRGLRCGTPQKVGYRELATGYEVEGDGEHVTSEEGSSNVSVKDSAKKTTKKKKGSCELAFVSDSAVLQEEKTKKAAQKTKRKLLKLSQKKKTKKASANKSQSANEDDEWSGQNLEGSSSQFINGNAGGINKGMDACGFSNGIEGFGKMGAGHQMMWQENRVPETPYDRLRRDFTSSTPNGFSPHLMRGMHQFVSNLMNEVNMGGTYPRNASMFGNTLAGNGMMSFENHYENSFHDSMSSQRWPPENPVERVIDGGVAEQSGALDGARLSGGRSGPKKKKGGRNIRNGYGVPKDVKAAKKLATAAKQLAKAMANQSAGGLNISGGSTSGGYYAGNNGGSVSSLLTNISHNVLATKKKKKFKKKKAGQQSNPPNFNANSAGGKKKYRRNVPGGKVPLLPTPSSSATNARGFQVFD